MMKHFRKSITYLVCFMLFFLSFSPSIALAANNNALLSSITLDDVAIADFDSNTFTYNVDVDAAISEIAIAATPEDTNAIITGDTGTQTLSVGANTFTITCTTEDGVATQDYTLNINRAAPPLLSTDATLSDINTDGSTIEGFTSDTFSYNLTVANTVEQIVVGAIASNDNAQVTGDTGTQSLSVGENTLTITCTAEDGVTKNNYVLNVTRDSGIAPNTDATLSDIAINGTSIEGFSPNILEYNINVDWFTMSTTIVATTTDTKSVVSGDIDTQDLIVGLNTLIISVTAEDGTSNKSYTINITREEDTSPIVHFDCQVFKREFHKYDKNNDGELSQNEMKLPTGQLSIWRQDVKDLTGLKYAKNITEISFGHLIFETIEADNFEGMDKLERIGMQKCRVQNIDSYSFKDLVLLESIIIQYNYGFIDIDIHDFSGLVNLQELFINNSSIKEIDELSFADMENLERLTMTGCGIDNLKNNTFTGLSNLLDLTLNNNSISSIENETFQKLPKLETLVLHSNNISTINSLMFSEIDNLKSLSLDNNKITNLDNSPFTNLENLEYLSFYNDSIATIKKNNFVGLNSLKKLRLENNIISSIEDDSFINLKNLEELSLGTKLTSIKKEYFTGLTNLTSLSLRNNLLTSIDSNAFEYLSSLESLNLSFNTIQSLHPDLFLPTRNLIGIGLTDNLLIDINSNQFLELENLENLSIYHNYLNPEDAKDYNHIKQLEDNLEIFNYQYQNEYKLILKDAGKNDIERRLYYGEPITLPIVEKEGHIFLGWDINSDGTADKMAGDEIVFTPMPPNEFESKVYNAVYTLAEPTLHDILVDGQVIDGFASDVYAYDMAVDYTKSQINIQATVTGDGQIIGDTGPQNLSIGVNTFTLTYITNSGLNTQDYVLHITRNDSNIVAIPNSNAFEDLGFIPNDMALDSDKQFAYLTEKDGHKLYRINLSNGEVSYLEFLYMAESITIKNGKLYLTLLHRPHTASLPFGAGDGSGTISVIDTDTFNIINFFDIILDPYYIEVDNQGIIYIGPGSNQSSIAASYNSITGECISTLDCRHISKWDYNNNYNKLYSITQDVLPRFLTAYQINNGIIENSYNSTYSDTYMDTTYIKISPDGQYIFSASGNIFRCSSSNENDMIKYDSIENFSSICFDLDNNAFYTVNDNILLTYDYNERTVENQFTAKDDFVRIINNNGQLLYLQKDFEEKYFLCSDPEESTSIVPVTGVSLNKNLTNIRVNDNETLIATLIPNNATNKHVKWSTSNPSVATVEIEDGIVYARSVGTCEITVTTLDGGYTDTCTVTVLPGPYIGTSPTSTNGLQNLEFVPFDMAIDPDSEIAYMTETDGYKLYRIDLTTGEVKYMEFVYKAERLTINNGNIYVTLLHNPHKDWLPNDDGAGSGTIAIVDTATFAMLNFFDVALDPYDIEVDNQGIVFLGPGSDQSTKVMSYNGTTGENLGTIGGVDYQSFWKYNMYYNKLYSVSQHTSPRDIEAYEVSNGQLIETYSSPYHGNYSMTTYMKISPDGQFIFNGSGNIFTCAPKRAGDMIYDGNIDSFDSICFDINNNVFYTSKDKVLRTYNYYTRTVENTTSLQDELVEIFYEHGKPIFLQKNSDGNYYIDFGTTASSQAGKVALLFGMADYTGDANDLNGPVNDMIGTQAVLEHSGYRVYKYMNYDAAYVLNTVEAIASNLSPDSTLLFTYSGHGSDGGYLVGADLNGISINDLESKLSLHTGVKEVIIDACYSGDFIDKNINSKMVKINSQKDFNEYVISVFKDNNIKPNSKSLAETGYYVITACSGDQLSYEFAFSIPNSPFASDNLTSVVIEDTTYYILGYFSAAFHEGFGLYNDTSFSSLLADTNSDNILTWNEIYQYAAERTNDEQQAQMYPTNSSHELYHGNVSVPTELLSTTYTIDQTNSIANKVRPKTSVDDFKSNFSNSSSQIKVFDSEDNEVTSGYVGTGMTVKLVIDNEVKDELDICIMGDISGDGIVDITDILYIRAHIIGDYTIENVAAISAELNNDDIIDITDILYIRAHIIGTYDIHAN